MCGACSRFVSVTSSELELEPRWPEMRRESDAEDEHLSAGACAQPASHTPAVPVAIKEGSEE